MLLFIVDKRRERGWWWLLLFKRVQRSGSGRVKWKRKEGGVEDWKGREKEERVDAGP